MNILFITSSGSSVPSIIKGGAVESLMEHLIERNEIEKKYDISVVSTFDDNSFKESKKYKKTKFIYIKRHNFLVKMLNFYSKLFFKFFPNYYNKFNLNSLDYLFKINKNIDFKKYDKIIFQNRATYINGLKKIKKNKNLYLHLHNDYLPWKDPRSKNIYDRFKKIWVVSDYIRKCTLSPNYSEDKIKVFFNCINTNLFNKDLYLSYKKKLREELNINENDVVFVFSGRITKEKGIKELLEAFSMLKYKNIKLLIIGSYDYGKKDKNSFMIDLEERFKKLKNKVIFTGFINRDDVPKYLGLSDVAIIPSMWEEPSGLVIMEAQASKLPLITTDSGGIPEIININSTFIIKRDKDFIKNLKEKMEFLYLNPKERKIRGELGRKHIEKYNLDFYWEQFQNLVEED